MENINRKAFFKKTCLAAVCMCGFGAIAANNRGLSFTSNPQTAEDERVQLIQDWISSLLTSLNSTLEVKDLRPIIKQSSHVHYENLKMDEMLTEFEGNIEKFIGFLEEKWGWKINYNPEMKIIVADENKNSCVCPIIDSKNSGTSAICYCSEGYAEQMFSKVIGKPVQATVISSVRRGNKSCKYEIVYN